MPTPIFETSKLTPKGKLVRGRAATGTGEFIFRQFTVGGSPDGVIVHRETAQLGVDVQEGEVTGTAYDAPLVADTDDYYTLTHVLMADGAPVPGSAQDWTVWPLKGELASKDSKAPKPLLAGFRFQVLQDGRPTPWAAPKAYYETAGGEAKIEFPLELGFAFTIAAVAPCKIETPQPQAGRKRIVEFSVSFIAVFLRPPKLRGNGSINDYYSTPDTDTAKLGTIRQYVNLASTENGQDGLGNVVLLEVGVQGDTARLDPDKIGRAGRFVFITVTFTSASAGTLGTRNNPPPNLLTLPALTTRTEVTAMQAYTGKVELTAAGGTGQFKIDLGLAGGDRCKVEIGGTEGVVDQTLTFTNWRRIEYELMVPGCMAGLLKSVGTATLTDSKLDFPDGLTSAISGRLASSYIEYKRFGSKTFTELNAANLKNAWVPAAYLLKRRGGDGYLLTKFSALYGKAFGEPVAFTAAPPNNRLQIMVCDRVAGANGADNPDFTITKVIQQLNFTPLNYLILQYSANDFRNKVINFGTSTWTARVAAGDFPMQPVLTFAPQVITGDTKPKKVVVRETHQNLSVDLLFPTSWGTATSEVGATEMAKLDVFFGTTLHNPGAIATAGNEISIEIHAEDVTSDRKTARYNAVAAAVQQSFAANMPRCVNDHPGWDSGAGAPRTGAISEAWLTYETMLSLRVNIPGGALPGNLLGAALSVTRDLSGICSK